MTTTCRCPEPIHRAANHLTERALLGGTSLLSPGARVWTRGRLEDLGGRLDDAIDSAGSSVADRLHAVLADADPGVRQLAAEVLYVHLLFPDDVHGATKRRLLANVLTALPAARVLPPDLDAALDGGAGPTAGAYTRSRLSQLRFLTAAALAFRRLPPARRRELLTEPRRFADWLRGLEPRGGAPQREALLHLLFPQDFEPTASPALARRWR